MDTARLLVYTREVSCPATKCWLALQRARPDPLAVRATSRRLLNDETDAHVPRMDVRDPGKQQVLDTHRTCCTIAAPAGTEHVGAIRPKLILAVRSPRRVARRSGPAGTLMRGHRSVTRAARRRAAHEEGTLGADGDRTSIASTPSPNTCRAEARCAGLTDRRREGARTCR